MSKPPQKPITLKELAALLDLSPATVSRAINGQAEKYRIAEETSKRVLEAARIHGYTANSVARSLRAQRTYTVGVIVPEISEGYATTVLSGIEDELLRDGYFYFVVSHRHRADLLDGYPRLLVARSVEGIIAIDTPLEKPLPVPLVTISGASAGPGVAHIAIDHDHAARLALTHLRALGHHRIAFIRGQAFSSDTEPRWQAIVAAAAALGIAIEPQLVVQLEQPEPGPEPGAEATRRLLARNTPFTALFAFNDMSAMGAIHALRAAGLHIPADVSVLGFDDVPAAATHNPPLTTIRQPLRTMGQAAASALLGLIRGESAQPQTGSLTVHPELIVRESTAVAAGS
ncbi:MAG TPA: LacI family DNA-binding transcriptional regulator [Terracidiphilus sp.]|nr:LacI family DNA-binding transcriptional regulator [Terracidiphilus sp.]